MSQDRVNPLSNMSYVNKDFETIYPELLDLVKQLTYKWDPSISNESDPGVILLKLNALVADKCNYNIDKNVLECFPLSVTQESNARQLYEQLGYYMKWYQSAETEVSLKWIGDTSSNTYTIPAFTMVSDSDNEILYTLVGPSTGTVKGKFNVGSQKLKCDGTITTFKAIQGTAIKYDINSDYLITYAKLDNNNRLYFDTTDIAENGIFITNAGTNNYSSWERKDNLLVEDVGNTYYSFGVTKDGDQCYIEFPEDAESLMKDGIYITYVKTIGEQGNVAATNISKFYTDLIPEESTDGTLVLNYDNVKIQNVNAATNGEDPETIEEAYKNYKRTIGTFNTLVTLRDYINATLNSELVSNCFVTDRTNDPQSVYKIVSATDALSQTVTQVESVYDATEARYNPALTAFSLKLYLLQYKEAVDSYTDFDGTFEMIPSTSQDTVKSYLQDYKSIQHDYVDILTSETTIGKSHFCYFKNKYPVNCRITTQYSVETAAADEIKENIRLALWEQLNAKELEFGQEISTDLIYDIIENADPRIKKVSLDNIEYTTYAVYFDGSKFKEVAINNPAEQSITITPDNEDFTGVVNTSTFENKVGYGNYDSKKFKYSNSKWYLVTTSGSTETLTEVKLADYGVTLTGTPVNDDTFVAEFSPITQFRDEIYVKSVLAGQTQLFVKDETFDYRLNQSYNSIINDIEKLQGECTISFNQDKTDYQLRANENIQFYAPNIIDKTSYSDYCKFEYYITSDIEKGATYQLGANEYLILYWKEEEDENAIYKYASYGEGCVFSPTFAMSKKTSTSGIIGQQLAVKGTTLRQIGTDTDPEWVGDSNYNGNMSSALSESLSELTGTSYVLSGSKTITIKKLNQITLDSSDYFCYWILNDGENGKYTLFEGSSESTPPESSYTRVLNSGEYFIYSNSALTDLIILGSGTELIRQNTQGQVDASNTWSVDILDSSEIIREGAQALANYWFKIPSGKQIKVTENQYVSATSGATVRIQKADGTGSWSLDFTKEPSASLIGYNIYYKSSSSEEFVKLEDIALTSHASWKGRTILSINVEPDDPQILLDKQKIRYRLFDSTAIAEIEGAASSNNSYPVVLMASDSIHDSSGELVDVYDRNSLGDAIPLSLYRFKQYTDNETTDIYYNSAGAVVLYFRHNAATETKEFKFSLPAGTYILPITNSHDDLTTFTVKLDNVNLHAMHNSSIINFNATGNHYIALDITNDTTEHTLSITIAGHQEEVIITLTNPYRYNKPDTLESWEFEKMKKLVSTLDPNNVFDYTNEVSEDDEIVDPLASSSFNLSNHIFNSFTICELDKWQKGTNDTYILGVLGKN